MSFRTNMNAYSLTSHTKRFPILFSYQTSCRICLPVIRLPFKFPLINFSNGYGMHLWFMKNWQDDTHYSFTCFPSPIIASICLILGRKHDDNKYLWFLCIAYANLGCHDDIRTRNENVNITFRCRQTIQYSVRRRYQSTIIYVGFRSISYHVCLTNF